MVYIEIVTVRPRKSCKNDRMRRLVAEWQRLDSLNMRLVFEQQILEDGDPLLRWHTYVSSSISSAA